MSFPIAEQIRLALRAVLVTVNTTAQDGTTQPLAVEDVNRYGNGTSDLETVIEQGNDKWLDESEEAASVGKDTYHQEFFVWVNVQTPATSNIPFDQRANTIAADVRRAVMVSSYSGTLQPLAEWIKPKGMTVPGLHFFNNDAGETAGIIIPFTARYTTALNRTEIDGLDIKVLLLPPPGPPPHHPPEDTELQCPQLKPEMPMFCRQCLLEEWE